jgi:hypothetical protein
VHRRAADRRRLIASFTANGFAATAVASAAAARREAAAAAAASAPFSVAVIEDQLPGAESLKRDLVQAGISVVEVDGAVSPLPSTEPPSTD